MILDMWSVYTEYLNKANKTNKKRNHICTCGLELKQELHISNEKKEQAVLLLLQ